jgi:hypothetical protein
MHPAVQTNTRTQKKFYLKRLFKDEQKQKQPHNQQDKGLPSSKVRNRDLHCPNNTTLTL